MESVSRLQTASNGLHDDDEQRRNSAAYVHNQTLSAIFALGRHRAIPRDLSPTADVRDDDIPPQSSPPRDCINLTDAHTRPRSRRDHRPTSENNDPLKNGNDGASHDEVAILEDANDEVVPRSEKYAALGEDDQHGTPETDEDCNNAGAVKIRPRRRDRDHGDMEESGEDWRREEDGDDSASFASSDENSEAQAWEGAENADDDVSHSAAPNTCIFCKQDEDNDPSDEYEAYLGCGKCGANAHQQCARDQSAIDPNKDPASWLCPDCSYSQQPVQTTHSICESAQGACDQSELADVTASAAAFASKHSEDAALDLHHSLDDESSRESRSHRKRRSTLPDNIMTLRKRRRTIVVETRSALVDRNMGSNTRPLPQSLTIPARISQPKPRRPPIAFVSKPTQNSLHISFRVDAAALGRILGGGSSLLHARSSRPGTSQATGPVDKKILLTPRPNFAEPLFSFFDRETDEIKGKPYGGILGEAEADTSRTLPLHDDRRLFNEAKQRADEEWRLRVLALQDQVPAPAKKPKRPFGPASQIECIEFGGWEIDTWYAAPYPEEYSRNRVLYICEFCLKYMNSDYVAWRHKLKCPSKHPPGDEIYRHQSVSVFEVDGRKNPVYCQNLCLLAKLFLGSKTLYYDVEPFLFYILCEYDQLGYHFVGYFSKEKRASSQNNVSCILTLPIHQRKGYGHFLIDFSYLLTRVEQKNGSPEKPLSDMGLVSYRNYWRLVICRYLLDSVTVTTDQAHGISIRQIADDTGLTPDDVISALEGLRCLVRDPQSHLYAFRVNLEYCQQYVAKWEAKNYVRLNPHALTWTPYVMGRSISSNFELGTSSLDAIAARDELDDCEVGSPISPPTAASGSENADPSSNLPVPSRPDPQPVTPDTPDPMTADLVTADQVTAGLITSDPVTGVIGADEVKSRAEDTHWEARPGAIGDIGMIRTAPSSRESSMSSETGPVDWTLPYKDIPATRFVVYPHLGSGRRLDRPRPGVARPLPSRMGSGAARQRQSAGASSRQIGHGRRSGGTGRGPGRWPKGTKKSDYGNAESGPGLPVAWIKDRDNLNVVTEPIGSDGDHEAQQGPDEAGQVAMNNVDPPVEGN